MIYEIPDSKLNKLEKQCNRIRNKGAEVTFEIKNPCFIKAINNDKLVVPGHEVNVEGFYRINDWEFIATIEHTPAGNIIRSVIDDMDIPSKYRTCGPECEHCHRIRDRKDTYLIRNVLTDEYKQVGKTCLREYTNGLDAQVCADLNSFFVDLEDADYFEEDGFSFGRADSAIDAKTFKKHAYGVVKAFGYQKEKTVEQILASLNGNLESKITLGTDKDLEPITEYANSITDEYGYMANAKVAWQLPYLEPRDFALVASFINTYFKYLSKLAQQKKNSEETEWVGNVGDKITIDVASYRLLFSSSTEVAWHVYSHSYTYEIIDKEGHIFIWKAHNHGIDYDEESMQHRIPLKIKGTVKAHSEYQGKKQTVLTRCKVIESKPLNTEGIQSNGEAMKAMDDLIDYIDEK